MAKDSSKGQGNVPGENHEGVRSFKSFNKKSKRFIPKALFAHSVEDFQDPVTNVKVKQSRSEIHAQQTLARNNKLALVIAATHSVGFLTPVWVIFGKDQLGLTLFAALVLGSTDWVSSAVFEVPMGAFADKFGRQLSLVLGLGLSAIGCLSFVLFHNFWLLMSFQVLAGLGYSMRSGSLEGLLHDTYEATGVNDAYSKLSSTMLFLSNGSRIFTVPIGAWLYSLNIHATPSSYTYPYLANTLFLMIALFAAVGLIEKRSSSIKNNESTDSQTTKKNTLTYKLFGHVGETFNEMKANSYVKRIAILFGLYALIGEGNWALYQEYFRDRGMSVKVSGWVYVVMVICMTVGSKYVIELYKRINVVWLMNFIILLMTVGIAWLHLPIYIAMPAIIINSLIGPMCLYLQDNAIQNRMSGEHKTTALSLSSMNYNIGSMIGIFGIGAIADKFGVSNAHWILVIYGSIVFVGMAIWLRGEKLSILPDDAKGVGSISGEITSDKTDIFIDEASNISPKTGA